MRIVWSNAAKADVKGKIVYKVFSERQEILIATVFDTRQNPTKLNE